jgi:hypothetical protein
MDDPDREARATVRRGFRLYPGGCSGSLVRARAVEDQRPWPDEARSSGDQAVPNTPPLCYNLIDKPTMLLGSWLRPPAQDNGGVEMMRPTSPDPPAPPPTFSRDGQGSPTPTTDWRMRYEMGCLELIGWMILGGFLGVFVCTLAVIPLARALGPPRGF